MEHIDPAVIYRFDTRSSRPCEFCQELDPQFPNAALSTRWLPSAAKPLLPRI